MYLTPNFNYEDCIIVYVTQVQTENIQNVGENKPSWKIQLSEHH